MPKIVKMTYKRDIGEGFEVVLKRLSAAEFLDIQGRAVTVKPAAGMTKENAGNYTTVDQRLFRTLRVLASIVSWNFETDDSTPESPKYIPINEDAFKLIDNNHLIAIENEIEKLYPSQANLKN